MIQLLALLLVGRTNAPQLPQSVVFCGFHRPGWRAYFGYRTFQFDDPQNQILASEKLSMLTKCFPDDAYSISTTLLAIDQVAPLNTENGDNPDHEFADQFFKYLTTAIGYPTYRDFNREGNLVDGIAPDEVNMCFPLKAVRPGESWTGFTRDNFADHPLQIQFEAIRRVHGLRCARLSYSFVLRPFDDWMHLISSYGSAKRTCHITRWIALDGLYDVQYRISQQVEFSTNKEIHHVSQTDVFTIDRPYFGTPFVLERQAGFNGEIDEDD